MEDNRSNQGPPLVEITGVNSQPFQSFESIGPQVVVKNLVLNQDWQPPEGGTKGKGWYVWNPHGSVNIADTSSIDVSISIVASYVVIGPGVVATELKIYAPKKNRTVVLIDGNQVPGAIKSLRINRGEVSEELIKQLVRLNPTQVLIEEPFKPPAHWIFPESATHITVNESMSS